MAFINFSIFPNVSAFAMECSIYEFTNIGVFLSVFLGSITIYFIIVKVSSIVSADCIVWGILQNSKAIPFIFDERAEVDVSILVFLLSIS